MILMALFAAGILILGRWQGLRSLVALVLGFVDARGGGTAQRRERIRQIAQLRVQRVTLEAPPLLLRLMLRQLARLLLQHAVHVAEERVVLGARVGVDVVVGWHHVHNMRVERVAVSCYKVNASAHGRCESRAAAKMV